MTAAAASDGAPLARTGGLSPVATGRATMRLIARRRAAIGRPAAPCRLCRAFGLFALLAVPLAALLIDPWFVDAHAPLPWVGAVERFVNTFGLSGWYIWPSAGVLAAAAFLDWRGMTGRRLALWTARIQLAWLAFLTFGLTEISSSILKQAIGRARPVLADTLGPYAFDPWTFTAPFASFPSGHSATFGAMVMLLALFHRRWWPGLAAAAFGLAFSRVVVGAHWPSDVIGGLAFGAAVAAAVAGVMARLRLGFRFDASGIPAPARGFRLI